jgi:branched-subunit amino acid aminotransferase/4-amino-4-deoxychorismate lyase
VVLEEDINIEKMKHFEEAFVCNSVTGLWPLKSIDDKQFFVGNITQSIQREVVKCLS